VTETVVARLRPHARALFWPTVLLLVVAAAAAYFGGRFAEPWQNFAVGGAAALLALVGWLAPLCRWLSRNYTITTRRVIVRSGIVVRVRQEMLHSRVHDITVRKNAIQTVFRSGDVLLEGGGERPVLLRDVPSADLVQEALHDLAEGADLTEPDADFSGR